MVLPPFAIEPMSAEYSALSLAVAFHTAISFLGIFSFQGRSSHRHLSLYFSQGSLSTAAFKRRATPHSILASAVVQERN